MIIIIIIKQVNSNDANDKSNNNIDTTNTKGEKKGEIQLFFLTNIKPSDHH